MIVNIRDRYIVFGLISETEVDLRSIKTVFWQVYQLLFGLSKTAEAGLFFEVYDTEKGKGLLRCTQQSLSCTLTTMSMITEINSIPVLIYPIYISGTIKKAKKYL